MYNVEFYNSNEGCTIFQTELSVLPVIGDIISFDGTYVVSDREFVFSDETKELELIYIYLA